MGPWGQGMGPECPMGSRGRPMGPWGQGRAHSVPWGQGVGLWVLGVKGGPTVSHGVKG